MEVFCAGCVTVGFICGLLGFFVGAVAGDMMNKEDVRITRMEAQGAMERERLAAMREQRTARELAAYKRSSPVGAWRRM